MVKKSVEEESNRITTVSLMPKLVIPIKKFNLSAGAGISYINHSIPGMNIKDELIKTSSSQQLVYASTSPWRPPNVRGGLGGDFRFGVSYWPTQSIAITVDAGYLLTPNYNAKIDLLNATDTNGDGLFSPVELRNGTMQTITYNYNLNAVRFNVGIKIALQRKHEYNGHVTLLK
jgi:hypothetical protein